MKKRVNEVSQSSLWQLYLRSSLDIAFLGAIRQPLRSQASTEAPVRASGHQYSVEICSERSPLLQMSIKATRVAPMIRRRKLSEMRVRQRICGLMYVFALKLICAFPFPSVWCKFEGRTHRTNLACDVFGAHSPSFFVMDFWGLCSTAM